MCRRFGTPISIFIGGVLIESVLKRRHIKFRGRGITQKKEYNICNTTKVLNQDFLLLVS